MVKTSSLRFLSFKKVRKHIGFGLCFNSSVGVVFCIFKQWSWNFMHGFFMKNSWHICFFKEFLLEQLCPFEKSQDETFWGTNKYMSWWWGMGNKATFRQAKFSLHISLNNFPWDHYSFSISTDRLRW